MSIAKELEAKINKAQIVRDGFAKLGMEASTKQIQEFYNQKTGGEIDRQYVYLQKSQIRKGKTPKKDKDKTKIVKMAKNASFTNSGEFVSVINNIKTLIAFFSDKKQLIAAVESI
jgi:hypothetical protein